MGRACSSATLTCLQDPTTPQQACLDADVPDCRQCLDGEIFACATSPGGGCSDEAGFFECCADANCGTVPQDQVGDCISRFCAAETVRFFDCVNQTVDAMVCGSTLLCFP